MAFKAAAGSDWLLQRDACSLMRDEVIEALTKSLDMSEEAVRSAVFKLRRRFREFVEEEVAETCVSSAEAKEEIAHLCRILAR